MSATSVARMASAAAFRRVSVKYVLSATYRVLEAAEADANFMPTARVLTRRGWPSLILFVFMLQNVSLN